MPRRLRPRADGLDRGPLPRAAHGGRRPDGRRASAQRRCPGRSAAGEGDERRVNHRHGILFEHIDEPGLQRLDVYERLGGYRGLRKALTEMDQDQVLKELEASGLRGRGGAGFSMGKKASFLPHGDVEKYLCCNADESEPGTFKDRELMHRNPHQLVEGVLIGAFAAGASHAFIYIRGEYEEEADILDAAVNEAYARGYVGDNILDSGFS